MNIIFHYYNDLLTISFLKQFKRILEFCFSLFFLTRFLQMLDKEDVNYPSFDMQKSEFDNPTCHTLYMILIELICLPVFCSDGNSLTSTICKRIMNLFFNG